MTAFRVFSGWDSRQAEAAEVFAYSVQANASIDVDIWWLKGKGGEVHAISGNWDAATPLAHNLVAFPRVGVTQFTYRRFLVPWLCGFEGRALFADGCDQLCLGDVAELAEFDMRGRPIAVVKHPNGRPLHEGSVCLDMRRPRVWTSLMLMDCSRLTMWTPERVEREPDDVLMRLRHLSDEHIGELPPEWNALCGVGFEEVEVTRGPLSGQADDERKFIPGAKRSIEPDGAKILHWSYLADPNGNSWIDRSGSALWAEWRERWRATV